MQELASDSEVVILVPIFTNIPHEFSIPIFTNFTQAPNVQFNSNPVDKHQNLASMAVGFVAAVKQISETSCANLNHPLSRLSPDASPTLPKSPLNSLASFQPFFVCLSSRCNGYFLSF